MGRPKNRRPQPQSRLRLPSRPLRRFLLCQGLHRRRNLGVHLSRGKRGAQSQLRRGCRANSSERPAFMCYSARVFAGGNAPSQGCRGFFLPAVPTRQAVAGCGVARGRSLRSLLWLYRHFVKLRGGRGRKGGGIFGGRGEAPPACGFERSENPAPPSVGAGIILMGSS